MRRVLAVTFLAVLPFSFASGTTAQAQPAPDRIEEDWELVVATPDPDVTGPQITTSVKPDSGDSSTVMAFNMNYRDHPSFAAGGLQVKAREGDDIVAASSQGTAHFETTNETITWTQRLSLSDGNLKFKVTSGQSTTWGEFGLADDQLAVSAPTSLTSLAGYSPDTTRKDSRVSFQSNRVTKMTLLRVRYYQGDTLLSTDESPRQVDLEN